MKLEYVLASGNPGKLREIEEILTPLGIVVRPQSDWQVPEADETAHTFVENSLIKARQAARHTGLPAIADDSGLVVPSLGGDPGIYSARYAGHGAGDRANIRKLLEALSARPPASRAAYFYCAMVLVRSADDPAPLLATGRWNGRILDFPQGDGGFGYDPVFGIPGQSSPNQTRSAAELTAAEKCTVSHRGQALQNLVTQLLKLDVGLT